MMISGLAAQNQNGEEITDVIEELSSWKARLQDDPFKITGNIRSDLRFNYINGLSRRADPFDFRINGNINVHSLGFRTGINFNFSDGRVLHRLSRPDVKLPSYAFLGMSPSYKWMTLHLGYRSLQFSQYTLANHNFYGAGIEINPGKFRFTGFYGRLRRAVPENLEFLQSIDPSYKRIGWGFKTGYKSQKDEISFVLFSAKDDPLSISIPLNRPDVLPSENVVLGLLGTKRLSSVISVNFDYAWSAFTRDNRSAEIEDREDISFLYDLGGLYAPKISTGFHKALKTGIRFNFPETELELLHERVDPGYQSMGALFFNNDYENLTASLKKDLLVKKLRLVSKLGFQRNNLSRSESNSSRRLIGHVNLSYQISDSWNANLSFSNFSNTNILSLAQLPNPVEDSIILTQVTRNLQASSSIVTGKRKASIFSVMLAYQEFYSITNDVIDVNQVMDNFISNVSHTYRFTDNKTNLTNSLLLNYHSNNLGNFTSLAPTSSLSRQFLDKKMQLKYSLTNVLIYNVGEYERRMMLNSFQGSYKITDKQKIILSITALNQVSVRAQQDSFFEFNTRIKYQLRL